jgi:hypothetical protein
MTCAVAVQLDLMGDDNQIVQREFPAVVFAGGNKGLFKLKHDERRLREMLSAGSEVTFVGKFKEQKKDGEFTLHVTDFNTNSGSGAQAKMDSTDETASPVYSQRCARPATDRVAVFYAALCRYRDWFRDRSS